MESFTITFPLPKPILQTSRSKKKIETSFPLAKPILRKENHLPRIDFDPSNAEHLKAYLMLEGGKNHPTLRFKINYKAGFSVLLNYLRYEVANYHANRMMSFTKVSE